MALALPLGFVGRHSPTSIRTPMRTRSDRPCDQPWSLMPRWAWTAAATASVAEGNTAKKRVPLCPDLHAASRANRVAHDLHMVCLHRGNRVPALAEAGSSLRYR
jgi:hypothetical protein